MNDIRSGNLSLRRAVADARLREVDVATALRVDPKTVQRWLGGRRPHAHHRWQLADLLNRSENDLWPELTAASPIDPEIVATYPHRSAVPRSVWLELLDRATERIDVLVYSGLFLAEDVGLLTAIAARAKDGVTVRLLLGDPASEAVTKRGDQEGIGPAMPAKVRNALVLFRAHLPSDGVAIRLHGTTLYNSVYRADDQLLVNHHVYGLAAGHAPMSHLRRERDGGLFDTYAASVDRVWEVATQLPE